MKSKKTKKPTKPKKKLSKVRMISKTKYKQLLSKKKLSTQEKQQLNHALFINYCKCIKKLKFSRKLSKGSEYPICMNSIYVRRKRKPPKGVTIKCKRYKK